MSSHHQNAEPAESIDYRALAARIKDWATELGFDQAGITDTDLSEAEDHLNNWLDADRHGEMSYMAAHGAKRSRPGMLVPGTRRVICVRMSYWPGDAALSPDTVLNKPDTGYVARYALGRDYHKVLRRRLQKLADRIEREVGPFGYRAFTDSAPVMEKPLAEKAGLGWHAICSPGRKAPGSFSGSCIPTCRCRWTSRPPITAAAAGPASMPAPPAPSPVRTSSTHAAASPT